MAGSAFSRFALEEFAFGGMPSAGCRAGPALSRFALEAPAAGGMPLGFAQKVLLGKFFGKDYLQCSRLRRMPCRRVRTLALCARSSRRWRDALQKKKSPVGNFVSKDSLK